MNDISIGAVRITFPSGASGLGHIYQGNWYQGQIVKQQSGWEVYLNGNSVLSVEDCEVIKGVVRERVAD